MNKVEFIKALREDGCTYQKIGEIFGVSYQAINDNLKYRFPKTKVEKNSRCCKRQPKEYRLLKNISYSNKNDCWLWTGLLHVVNGYGRMGQEYAHRLVYEFYYGQIPKQEIMHSCDNPACVNPRHLIPATHKENMNDRDIKGRGKGFVRTLSADQVMEIRNLYNTQIFSISILSRMFGVSGMTIRRAIKRIDYYKNV